MKTKGKEQIGEPQIAAGQELDPVFRAVEIVESAEPGAALKPVTVRDRLFKLSGSLETTRASLHFHAAKYAEFLDEVKRDKLYEEVEMTYEQFVLESTPFRSVDTADRAVALFREFGKGAVLLKEYLRVSAQALREAGAQFVDEGVVEVAGERFKISKQNAPMIQVAIETERQRLARASGQISHQKGRIKELEGKVEQAAEEKKQLETELAGLRESQSEVPKPNQLLLQAQGHIDAAVALLYKAQDVALSDEDMARLRGVTEYSIRCLIEAGSDDPVQRMMAAHMKGTSPAAELIAAVNVKEMPRAAAAGR